MSQAKVDKYKEQKANRKEIMKKEKRHNQIVKASAAVIGVVMIGWVGFSAYDAYQSAQPRETVEIDYTAFETYLNSIGAEE